MQAMQYGGMHLLRASGWAAVIVAVPAVLIVGVVAAHRPSLPSLQPAGAPRTVPAANPHPASAGTDSGGQSQSAAAAIDPACFSPGSCVAFPPTTGNRHLTVFLDAGHGGPDPGAVGITRNGKVIYEADQTLPVVLDTATILRLAGFRVVVSRTGPTSVPDAGVQSDQGLGSSLTPADVACGHLLLLGPAEKGCFSTPSTMPGALVEPLFITDPFEGSIAASSHGQQVIAAGLADAVEHYFAPGSAP